MDEALRQAARAALLELWRDGSPVVRPEDVEKITAISWRRWRSFHRRAKRSTDFEARVEDLAKGLRDTLEADPKLSGPLIEDYRFMARTLAVQFAHVGVTGRSQRGS